MADLSVTFAGVKMRNPVGVAAHAPNISQAFRESAEAFAAHLMRYVDRGAGHVTLAFLGERQTFGKGEQLTCLRFRRCDSPYFPRTGLFAAFGHTRGVPVKGGIVPLDLGLKTMDILRSRLADGVALIANIIAGSAEPKSWADLAKKYEAAGADLIELDTGCPLPPIEADAKAAEIHATAEVSSTTGGLLGDHLQLLIPVVEETVKAVRIPVGVKLTPETGFPRIVTFAQALKKAGAGYISGINSPISVGPPDIYNGGKGKWMFGDDVNAICALSGPWDRFLCYKHVSCIALFVPGIEISAIGGLVEPEHVVEVIMLGAGHVQLSSGILWRGTDLIEDTINFLNDFMDSQGYKTIGDYKGCALKYIKPTEEIDGRLGELVAKIDPAKCNRCGICCNNICWAHTMEERKIKLDAEYCSGCGLCEAICPQGAITIVEKKHRYFMLE